jgi:hypothetical protein
MSLRDMAVVEGRAYWMRKQCGLLQAEPPFSTNAITDRVFPRVAITGDRTMPDGITEMVLNDRGRFALFYSKKVGAPSQRLGILHGCYHTLTDLALEEGQRECNLTDRKFRRYNPQLENAIEVNCDMFAGALLAPFDVLDDFAPRRLFPQDPDERHAFDDEVDRLASKFAVPAGFMNWRLFDLAQLRKTHYRF